MGLRGTLVDVVDMKLISDSKSWLQTPDVSPCQGINECLVSLFRLGLSCSQELPSNRMQTGDIISELHAIKEYLSIASSMSRDLSCNKEHIKPTNRDREGHVDVEDVAAKPRNVEAWLRRGERGCQSCFGEEERGDDVEKSVERERGQEEVRTAKGMAWAS
uniref:Serine-threonine/tyrosine-protein kinase catalytic domain-containing protein n=1 Tax=Leersia perrieri TaxID=77586 RepID=A0A0D9XT90_9ORYZ